MGDFEDKLDRILNDPQAMSQIMSLAQTLGGSTSQPESQAVNVSTANQDIGSALDPRLLSEVFSLFTQCSQADDQRVALLLALKPFIREERHTRLEKAIQITKLSHMVRMALELFRKEDGEYV